MLLRKLKENPAVKVKKQQRAGRSQTKNAELNTTNF
jgi:hypothetical protein